MLIDFVRLAVYGAATFVAHFDTLPNGAEGIVAAATLSAFAGAYLGARMLKKLTLQAVQVIVAVFMVAVGAGLAAGFV